MRQARGIYGTRRAAGWLLGALALMVWAGMAGAGCGDDGTTEPTETNNNTTSQPPQGVRVFYALTSPASADIVLLNASNDEFPISGLSTGSVSDYLALDPGDYRALVFEGGTRNPTGVQIDGIQVTSSSTTTLALSPDASGDPKQQIFSDDLSAPAENGARVRFVYRASGPPTDLYYADGTRVQDSLALGEQVPYTVVTSGFYDFVLRPEGIAETLYSMDQLALAPGGVHTVFISGSTDPNGDGDTSDQNLTHTLVDDHVYQ